MKTIILKTVKKINGLVLAVFLMSLFSPASFAQAVHTASDFNHMKTGFPLTGAHARVECETCHVGGLFKGTPTNCEGCHSVGRRVVAPVKSANHMLTNAACNTCHTNTVTFIGARYNHLGVQPKACSTCHNGRIAPSKPSGHIQTTLSCDSCHRSSSWLPAGFDHAPPLATCETCHGPAGPAKGKPANHVPVPAGVSCDSCHKSGFTTFLGAMYDHVGSGVLPGTCSTCHVTGQYGAKTKTSTHIPTGNIACDSCHANYASFAAPTMNHSVVEAVPIKCSTCHNGSFSSQGSFLGGAKGKNSTHVVTTEECGTCHLGRSSFLGGLFVHATATPAVAGRCATCHNGTNALGKTNTPTHNGTTASCDACHGTANGYTSFAGAVFAHAGVVPGTCGTCHLGQSATVKTKSLTHIPTSGNACDACHLNTTTFTAFTMQHSAVTTIACATCHNGSYLTEGVTGAQAQSTGHVVTNGAACSTCHTTTAWTPASYAHTGVLPATCGTCHLTGVSGAKMKSTGHIPYNANACDGCHKSGYAIGAFANATMSHTTVSTASCTSCHNGSYLSEGTQYGGAKAKSSIANHIPVTTECKVCHTGFTSFITPLVTSTVMHTSGIAPTACKTCHQANVYKGVTGPFKSVNHDKNGSTDCTDSGCHKPAAGGRGTAYITW